jgi:hypothetical protein
MHVLIHLSPLVRAIQAVALDKTTPTAPLVRLVVPRTIPMVHQEELAERLAVV